MNFLGGAVNLLTRALGSSNDTSQPFRIIEINTEVLKPNFTTSNDGRNRERFSIIRRESSEIFFLLKENNEIYHVTVIGLNRKQLSVYRDKDLQNALREYTRFQTFSSLFSLCETQNSFNDLVDSLHSKPAWSSLHHACALGIDRYLGNLSKDDILNQINMPCEPEHLYPLHLAIKNGRHALIPKLLSLGADLATVDTSGMTSLHYAAIVDARMIQTFRQCPKLLQCIDNENANGATPLHMSLNECKPDCAEALLKLGASTKSNYYGMPLLHYLVSSRQINPKFKECVKILIIHDPTLLNDVDNSTGDSVFHLASEIQVLHCLLQSDTDHAFFIDLNVKNKKGDTPLMVHLKRGHLECFVKILSYGADPECRDNIGNTALHLSVERGQIDFLKVLLIFGCDTNIENSKNEIVRHLAAKSTLVLKSQILQCLDTIEAAYCRTKLPDCTSVCSRKSDFDKVNVTTSSMIDDFAQSIAVTNSVKKKQQGQKLQNVLTLDGGGVRGLLLIQVLLCVEKRLGCSLISKFHWVSGTSTGAILAAALCQGKTLKECQQLYFRLKDEIFSSSTRPYETVKLEDFLKNNLGHRTSMADVKNYKLMIPTVIGNVCPMELFMFRNYQMPFLSLAENDKLGYKPPEDTLLWKACRCSSAAPTYFSSVEDRFIDGGMMTNNPTMDFLTEIQNYNWALRMHKNEEEEVKLGCIVSVGTGQIPTTATNTLNLQAPNTILDYITTALAVKDMTKILIHQVTESDGRPVDQARSFALSHQIPFFRFSTPLKKEVSLDETKNQVLIEALWQTIEFVNSKKHELDDIVELLR